MSVALAVEPESLEFMERNHILKIWDGFSEYPNYLDIFDKWGMLIDGHDERKSRKKSSKVCLEHQPRVPYPYRNNDPRDMTSKRTKLAKRAKKDQTRDCQVRRCRPIKQGRRAVCRDRRWSWHRAWDEV